MGFSFGNAIRAVVDEPTRACLIRLGKSHHTDNSTLSTLVRNNVSTSTITAGAGLTGGGPLNSLTSVTLNAGAGTGITVAADSISISSSYLGANPTGTIGLTAVNGSATTYMRSDAAPALGVGIVPTWTGIHTFSAQDVHNAGVSLGQSGVLTAAVTDAPGAIGLAYTPGAMTATIDRSFHVFKDPSGNTLLTMKGDSSFEFGGGGTTGGFITVGKTNITQPTGISFKPTIAATSLFTVGSISNCVGAAEFRAFEAATTADNIIGGVFVTATFQGRSHVGGATAGVFQAITSLGAVVSSANTHGSIYGIRVVPSSIIKSNFGTWDNGYMIHTGNVRTTTPSGSPINNCYGYYCTRVTSGATINNGVYLDSGTTAGYKALVLGSQSNWLAWESATTFSLNATTVLCKADFDVSAKNIKTDGTTGTTIALNATDKLGFFGIGPVIQPGAFTQTYSTASHTHANPTAGAVATTASTNVVPFGYTTAAQADDIIAQLNKLVTDMANVKQTLNAVIDDGQSLGLLA